MSMHQFSLNATLHKARRVTIHYLDTAPWSVGEKINGWVDVCDCRISQKKFQFGRINVAAHRKDLDGHLSCERQLVALEQTSRRVDENWVSNAVDQVVDAILQLLGFFCSVYRLFKHYTESLQSNNTRISSARHRTKLSRIFMQIFNVCSKMSTARRQNLKMVKNYNLGSLAMKLVHKAPT